MNMRLLFAPAVLTLVMATAAQSQTLSDPGLTITPHTTGLSAPTQMRFIGDGDFFVTE